jgi:hypothetical protein
LRFKLFVALSVLLTAASAWAHHGAAEFDQNNPFHLSGTISRTEWANPHVLIHLSVKGADGKVAEWLVECPPPNWMKRQGLTQSAVEAATEFDVEGYRAKDGSTRLNAANVVTVALRDGKLTLIGSGKGSQYTRALTDGLPK